MKKSFLFKLFILGIFTLSTIQCGGGSSSTTTNDDDGDQNINFSLAITKASLATLDEDGLIEELANSDELEIQGQLFSTEDESAVSSVVTAVENNAGDGYTLTFSVESGSYILDTAYYLVDNSNSALIGTDFLNARTLISIDETKTLLLTSRINNFTLAESDEEDVTREVSSDEISNSIKVEEEDFIENANDRLDSVDDGQDDVDDDIDDGQDDVDDGDDDVDDGDDDVDDGQDDDDDDQPVATNLNLSFGFDQLPEEVQLLENKNTTLEIEVTVNPEVIVTTNAENDRFTINGDFLPGDYELSIVVVYTRTQQSLNDLFDEVGTDELEVASTVLTQTIADQNIDLDGNFIDEAAFSSGDEDDDGEVYNSPLQLARTDSVQYIVETNCNGCHSAGSNNGDLLTPTFYNKTVRIEGINNNRQFSNFFSDNLNQLTGTLIYPQSTNGSYLYRKIADLRTDGGEPSYSNDRMPRGRDPLSDERLELIADWINGLSTCGDGIVSTIANEQCDDGNTDNADDCDQHCQFE